MLGVYPLLGLLAGLAHAQFPAEPTGLKIVASERHPDVKLSYKQHQVCETTEGVRSFAGYVHLPNSALTDLSVDFDINSFFLYFEARNDAANAPLVIYLAGGPGESSTFSAMSSEGGPCYVNPDGVSTTLNPWSLNNHANVLYVDQPVGAGFSYTKLVNGTFDIVSNVITPLEAYNGLVPESNITFGQGTFSDPSPWAVTNTTTSTARALWHFAEAWLTDFPEYKSNNTKIGIWGNSYGGFWAPNSAALFDKKIKESSNDSTIRKWSIDNIGITNGILDLEHDIKFSPQYVYNNSYTTNESLITEEVYQSAQNNLTKENGCRDLLRTCREAATKLDPDGTGLNEEANTLCQTATISCMVDVGATIFTTNRTAFDIAVERLPNGLDPCGYYLPVASYLNQPEIQQALGVSMNWTYISQAALDGFTASIPKISGTGDFGIVSDSSLKYLLAQNVSVAIISGDRDTRTQWISAEDFALNVDYPFHADYARAGFEYIQTNKSYQGGAVRQYDGFSFSRVFQAGHAVHAYQPETLDRIFSRTIFGLDLATGMKIARGGYSTNGSADGYKKLKLPDPKDTATCMVAGEFQKENVWAPIFAAVEAAQGGGGAGGNGTNETQNEIPSLSTKAQPRWSYVSIVSLVIAAVWLLA